MTFSQRVKAYFVKGGSCSTTNSSEMLCKAMEAVSIYKELLRKVGFQEADALYIRAHQHATSISEFPKIDYQMSAYRRNLVWKNLLERR